MMSMNEATSMSGEAREPANLLPGLWKASQTMLASPGG